MTTGLRHYGWECSPYSSKTRAYLRYKQLPHQDIYPTVLSMKGIMERKVGYMVMPILIQADGRVLQDSSHIIDQLEGAHPEPSILPKTPTQALVSSLLELFGDEWLPIISMHTRWDLPENRRFAAEEFGRCALPWLPLFLSKRIVGATARKMASYLPVLGINDETRPEIDAWAEELLDGLEAHFALHPYLLGARPCMADFSIYGPLYAHVWRDPASRPMVESRPQLFQWIQRMRDPQTSPGDFLEEDRIPETLLPILERMFREQLPVLRATVERLADWIDAHPERSRVPRGLGELPFQLGRAKSQRKVMTYQQWMLQRPLDLYQRLEPEPKARVDAFLAGVGGLDAMQLKLKHRLTRKDFRVVVAR